MASLISIGLVMMICSLPFFAFIIYDSRQVDQKLKYDFEECRTVLQVLLYIFTWLIVGVFAYGTAIVLVGTIAEIFNLFVGCF